MWALTHRHRKPQTKWPLASSPTEPTWEAPRALVPCSYFDHKTGKVTERIPKVTIRAEILDRARGRLKVLCCPQVPLSDLEKFFIVWHDPQSPKCVQPNALAWFQYATGLASTALGTAVAYGRHDAVRFLLEKGLKPTEMDMFWALRAHDKSGSRGVLEMFVDAGWDINRPINEHTAPLLGCLIKDRESVDWCLAEGASPDAASSLGYTAMQQAASTGSLDTMKQLVAHGGTISGTDLVAHVAFGLRKLTEDCLDMIYYLIDHGASVDTYYMAQSKTWSTRANPVFVKYGLQNALHLAISEGNRSLVRVLLARNASKDLEMFSLRTGLKQLGPKELAHLLGRDDIVELL